jgi:diadenosine tetraphosphatase ApaH/serine/threonine PP2A family protein phosphatase
MRYLVISDLHANLPALDAVLADAKPRGYSHTLLLGDLVGYGGDPAGVIDRALAISPLTVIRGNHDKVCAGLEPAAMFNDVARAAAEWTTGVLDPAHLLALAELPRGPVSVTDDIEICHGAPFDEDYYVFDEQDAAMAIRAAKGRICLFGHTHVPALFATPEDPFGQIRGGTDVFQLPARGPALINIGAVGQPRDRDPRAAYGILDLEQGTIELHRVVYDIEDAQRSIRDAGLPVWLADRLAEGQ